MSRKKEINIHFRKWVIALLIIYAGAFWHYGIAYGYVNTLNIYMSSDSTQADTNSSFLYPEAGMGSGTSYGINDWTYVNPKITSYVVPVGNQPFLSADFTIRFDSTFVRVTAQSGNIFPSSFIDTIYSSSGTLRINIASLSGNVTPDANKYMVKLYVYILKPGKSVISTVRSKFRFYDFVNNIQSVVPSVFHSSTVIFYTGDFAASQSVLYSGDGKVDFNDAAIFGQSYGTSVGDPLFRAKFDIAPSQGYLDYWQMPVGDGSIGFLDLVLFSLGYNYEATGVLESPLRKNVFEFSNLIGESGLPVKNGNLIRVPVALSGNALDIRGVSLNMLFDNSAYEFLRFEKADSKNENVFIGLGLGGNIVTIDAAVLGLSNPGFSAPCTLGYVVFGMKSQLAKNNSFPVISGAARNSFAREIKLGVNNKNFQRQNSF